MKQQLAFKYFLNKSRSACFMKHMYNITHGTATADKAK